MSKKTRITALLLTLLTLTSAVACSDAPAAPAQSNDTTAPVQDSTEQQETAETELQPDIPEKDFNGESFVILTSGAADTNGIDWQTYDIWVEGLNGDVINDAVYDRNLYIADTYNAVIEEVQSTALVYDQAQQSILAGADEYDAVMANIQASATMAQNGYTYNLYDIPYIDLTKPWWDQRAVSDLSIGGKVYYATGDITVIDNDATWVLMFNKQLINDLNLDSPYDLVAQDQWTYDKFAEMVAAGAIDKNGDGNMKYEDDQFGFATTGDSAQGLMYASGIKLVSQGDDGYPVNSINIERLTSVIEKAGKLMADRAITFNQSLNTSYSTDQLRFLFEEGRSLFYGEVMQCIIRMRASETEFGLVPWPKFDEGQDSYYNFVHATAGKVINIPMTQQNTEMAGAVIEAMAAKSMTTVTPAYYDVALTYKYMRDEESVKMLDVILDSRVYDLGYVYNWAGLYASIVGSISNGKDTFSSTYARLEKAYTKAINKTVEAYEKNAS